MKFLNCKYWWWYRWCQWYALGINDLDDERKEMCIHYLKIKTIENEQKM
jgi:hypothetical protein